MKKNRNRFGRKGISCILVLACVFSQILPVMPQNDSAVYAAESHSYHALYILPDYSSECGENLTSGGYGSKYNDISARITKADASASVKLDVLSSAEINCKNIDFLETYDYICLGTGSSNYRHVGDKVLEPAKLYTEYEIDQKQANNSLSFDTAESGNDITAKVREAIQEFYDAGYAVEFVSGFESMAGKADESSEGGTNAALLYADIKAKAGNNSIEKALVPDPIDPRNVRILASQERLSLTVSSKAVNGEKMNTRGSKEGKILQFKLKITNGDPTKKYALKFYTDNNYDGKFNPQDESLGYLSVKRGSMPVDPDQLEPNRDYMLTVDASDYIGLMSYQMYVSEKGASATTVNYATYSNSCVLHASDDSQKKTIRVLQLTSAYGTSNDDTAYSSIWPTMKRYANAYYGANEVYLPTKEEIDKMKELEANGRLNPENLTNRFAPYEECDKYISFSKESDLGYIQLKTMIKFYEAFTSEKMADYTIDVTRVYSNNTVAHVKKMNNSSSGPGADEIYNYFTDNYDMLILGFADTYEDIRSDAVCDAIKMFIAEGKSVLFTHDTSSMLNYSSEDKSSYIGWGVGNPNADKNSNAGTCYWGYNINKNFRTLLGMDRFASSKELAYYRSGTSGENTSETKEYEADYKTVTLGTGLGEKPSCTVNIWDPEPVFTTTSEVKIENVTHNQKPTIKESITITAGALKSKMSDKQKKYVLKWAPVYQTSTEKKVAWPETGAEFEDRKITLNVKGISIDVEVIAGYFDEKWKPSYFISKDDYNEIKKIDETYVEVEKNGENPRDYFYNNIYYYYYDIYHFSSYGYGYYGGPYYKLVELDTDDVVQVPTGDYNPKKVLNITEWNEKTSGTNTTSAVPNQGYATFAIKGDGGKTVNSVQQLNSGPINLYPYNLTNNTSTSGTSYTVASTHGQYYQLDLEDENVVVWYTLKSAYNGGVEGRDGRNNYYIYSKNNITYSGAGHSSNLTEEEVKLFINTIVSSYRSAAASVDLQITNTGANESSGSTLVNSPEYSLLNDVEVPVYYTEKADKKAYGSDIITNGNTQYKKVSFKLYAATLSSNKKISVSFSPACFANAIYQSGTGKKVAADDLESGVEYYVYIPLTEFKDAQYLTCNVTVGYNYTVDASGKKTGEPKKKEAYVKKIIFGKRTLANFG